MVQLLLQRALQNVFTRNLDLEDLKPIVDVFNAGAIMEVSSSTPSKDYMDAYAEIPELRQAAEKLGCSEGPPELASAAEFVLEGLHLNKQLNKKDIEHKQVYEGKPGALGL